VFTADVRVLNARRIPAVFLAQSIPLEEEILPYSRNTTTTPNQTGNAIIFIPGLVLLNTIVLHELTGVQERESISVGCDRFR